MSKMKEITEAIEPKLGEWEACVTAARALLQQTQEQVLEELEARKKRLDDALEELKAEVARTKGITHQNIMEIQARFEDLRVQLALGDTEAGNSFEAQKERIQLSFDTLEATVDRQLEGSGRAIDESLRKAADELIVAAIKLEAEMEVMAIHFGVKKDNARASFRQEKRALFEHISQYEDQLEEEKQMAKNKSATFESELSDVVSQIERAFKNLFDREETPGESCDL